MGREYEVSIGSRSTSVRVSADDARDAADLWDSTDEAYECAALSRAVQKLFGRHAFWKRDQGITTGNYGQVFVPMWALGYDGDWSSTSRTDRCEAFVCRATRPVKADDNA